MEGIDRAPTVPTAADVTTATDADAVTDGDSPTRTDGPPAVAVFGSVNVDRTQRLPSAELTRLADERDPFPAGGETLAVDEPPESFTPTATSLGGKGANQAVAAARAGASASFHGAVGPDAVSVGVHERFRSEGVEPELFERDVQTGAAYIWVTPDGENRIVVVAGANGTLSPADANARAARIAESEVLLLQNEIPVAAATALLDRLPESGPTVVCNPAPAAGAEPLVTHPAVDLLTPNEGEFDTLHTSLASVADDVTVVRTEAESGASVFRGSLTDPVAHVPAPTVETIDTTGAGDTFTGYLGAELADGRDFEAAVELAVRAASHSCEREGAMSAPPRSALGR